MQSENYGQLLDFAAHLWGIEPEYWDIWGRKHFTSNETKQAVLKGMGVRTGTAQSLRESIEARRRKEWTRLVPPCVVWGRPAARRDSATTARARGAGARNRPGGDSRRGRRSMLAGIRAARFSRVGHGRVRWPPLRPEADRTAGRIAAGLSRSACAAGGFAAVHATHCDAGAGLRACSAGRRRQSRGGGAGALRSAFRAQLGVRRPARPARRHRLDRGGHPR